MYHEAAAERLADADHRGLMDRRIAVEQHPIGEAQQGILLGCHGGTAERREIESFGVVLRASAAAQRIERDEGPAARRMPPGLRAAGGAGQVAGVVAAR